MRRSLRRRISLAESAFHVTIASTTKQPILLYEGRSKSHLRKHLEIILAKIRYYRKKISRKNVSKTQRHQVSLHTVERPDFFQIFDAFLPRDAMHPRY